MATVYWRNARETEVAQVKTFTITGASTSTTAVWTLTVTMDDGSTTTVTYTEDGSPNATEIATGLYNAWNASQHPEVLRIAATNPSAGVLVLTARTAGRPFNVTLADNDDGTDTAVDTQPNVGNSDWNTARNWSTYSVPTSADDVIVQGAGDGQTTPILYGLNQSAVALDEVQVLQSYNANIGRIEDGKKFYLRIDPDSLNYRGSGNLAMIDVGSAAIAPEITCNGTPLNGMHAVYLKGSAMTTVEVRKGKVGIAPDPGETATVATVLCSHSGNQQYDVDLTIGAGVTLTTLTQSGGRCSLNCAATTVTTSQGCETRTGGSGAITTWYVYGKAFPEGTGTISTMHLYGESDESGDRSARTISSLVAYSGSKLTHVPQVTHSALTLPATPGRFEYLVIA